MARGGCVQEASSGSGVGVAFSRGAAPPTATSASAARRKGAWPRLAAPARGGGVGGA